MEDALAAASAALLMFTPYLRRDFLKNEIENMESSFQLLKACIEKCEMCKGNANCEMHEMLEIKIHDVACEIEDVFHQYVLVRRSNTSLKYKVTRKFYPGLQRRKISKRLARIHEKMLNAINVLRYFPAINPDPSSMFEVMNRQWLTSPLLVHHGMIGYENLKKDFITQLLDSEENLLSLAVVGPSGSGKTTFVADVFSKLRYRDFDCHAWVNVSHHLNLNKLIINMLQQFGYSRNEKYSVNNSNLLVNLRRYLAGKRYIVVLDNVWSTELWEDIKYAFPNSYLGSRVIVATRSSEIATIYASSRNHEYSLNCLELSDAWKLFCSKAFPESNGECPSELQDCSEKIVKKCEGLPLALVLVGGALSYKPKHPMEWERFYYKIGYEIRNNSAVSVIISSLVLGYMDLSSNLKSCFLYFSIFPEDYSVECGRLIRLWVAERFAQETDGKTAEEVAEDYLNELVHRNLVQVSRWNFDGRPRNCRVHYLVLEFIIQKCYEKNFVTVFPSHYASHIQNIRRLAVHNDDYNCLPREYDFRGVRSMFLNGLPVDAYAFGNILRELKLLNTLEFQDAVLSDFPKEIIPLTLVRYLNFGETKISTIPSSIGNLTYLETLDLKQTDVRELPKEISRLHHLRHLFAYKYNSHGYIAIDSALGVKVHAGIGKLTNLQDLSLVEVDEKGRILKDLVRLSKLRKLGLKGLKGEHGEYLCAVIEKNQELRTLDLWSASKEECLDLGDLMGNPPCMLERLYLNGRLRKFPDWISSLNNLLRIGLRWSKMHQSPLGFLKLLPNLLELQLMDCYTGVELIFEASSFMKLKILLIQEFSQLHAIVIQPGAMPDVKEVSLHNCPKIMRLPMGIENLTKVEVLILRGMAKDLMARVRKHGEDHWRVGGIPAIHSFTLTHNEGWQFENLSGPSDIGSSSFIKESNPSPYRKDNLQSVPEDASESNMQLTIPETGEVSKFVDIKQETLQSSSQETKHCCNDSVPENENYLVIMKDNLVTVQLQDHQTFLLGAQWLSTPVEHFGVINLVEKGLPELHDKPDYSGPLLLFLQRNNRLTHIHSSFFNSIPGLCFLDLSDTKIKMLPTSLFELSKLKILMLRNCVRLHILPAEIKKLKRLALLDLSGTELYEGPGEIGQLTRLRHMQLSFYGPDDKSGYTYLPPELISPNVMSELKELQVLSITVHPEDNRWIDIAKDITMDVSMLEMLSYLQFYFPDVEHFEHFIEWSPSWEQQILGKFKFVVGRNVKRIRPRVPYGDELKYEQQGQCLRFVNGDTVPEKMKAVLLRVTAFYLDHHVQIKSLSEFGTSNLKGLIFCVVTECPNIDVIIDEEKSDRVLPFLEHLGLYYLWELKQIWKTPLRVGSFLALKSLIVNTCPKLKFLVWDSMLPCFANLEELLVEDCDSLEKIVEEEKDMGINYGTCVVLPRLRNLGLKYLPKLVCIGNPLWISKEKISIYACPILELNSQPGKQTKRKQRKFGWIYSCGWGHISKLPFC